IRGDAYQPEPRRQETVVEQSFDLFQKRLGFGPFFKRLELKFLEPEFTLRQSGVFIKKGHHAGLLAARHRMAGRLGRTSGQAAQWTVPARNPSPGIGVPGSSVGALDSGAFGVSDLPSLQNALF